MREWTRQALGQLVGFQKGRKVEVIAHPSEGFAPYLGAAIISGGDGEYADTRGAVMATPADVLMLWDGERSGLVGKGREGVVSSTVARLTPRDGIESEFLYYALDFKFDWIQGRRTGTGVPHVPKDLGRILYIDYPTNANERNTIAEILSTLDEAIEQTEALIAKTQAIKAGLMHDLFTRGVTVNGELRPPREEAPQLYKASPLGWIPKEWSVCRVDEIAIKVTDGDHYTPQRQSSGVYLLSARNVLNDSIALDDVDHVGNVEYERMIKRCHPEPGDILISCSGTIGRTCIVPSWLKCCLVRSVALIKLDPTLCFPVFIEQLLQGSLLQRQIKASQRQAAQPNLFQGEISALLLPTPSLPEQKLCAARLEAINSQHMAECEHRDELDLLRHGLMHDLLTGRVPVSLPESEALTADA